MIVLTISNLLAVIVALSILYLMFVNWIYSYWIRKGIKQATPTVPFGNFGPAVRRSKSFGETIRDIYVDFKAKGVRHGGIYGFFSPIYVPVDLAIIRDMLSTNFAHFVNHGFYLNEQADPLSGNLSNLEDDKWRSIRAKLTPTFTSSKMKMMFNTWASCRRELEKVIEHSVGLKEGVDIKEISARFATDVIGTVAFGLVCNTLKNPDAEFRKYGKMVFENSFWQNLKGLGGLLIPNRYLKMFKFKLNKPEVERFFMNVIHKNIDYRESNKIERKDFFQLLLELKNKDGDYEMSSTAKRQIKLTENEVAAHSFIFFLAGFETSATTMTWALYELAKDQKVQNKLRQEIDAVLKKYNGEHTYEAYLDMKYLEQVIKETLRKYTPGAMLFRLCSKDYTVPDTNVTIEKDTLCMIPIWGLHTDPEYFPNPEQFDPERFNDENKRKIPHYAWIPFGEGPRICIGSQFGMLQTRAGLISVLKGHRVTLHEKTKGRIQISKDNFITTPEGSVWLNIKKL